MKPKSRKKTVLPVADLAELLKPYSSGWVALSSDERQVVGAGVTLQEAHAQAAKQGHSHPVFVNVLPADRGYVSAQV